MKEQGPLHLQRASLYNENHAIVAWFSLYNKQQTTVVVCCRKGIDLLDGIYAVEIFDEGVGVFVEHSQLLGKVTVDFKVLIPVDDTRDKSFLCIRGSVINLIVARKTPCLSADGLVPVFRGDHFNVPLIVQFGTGSNKGFGYADAGQIFDARLSGDSAGCTAITRFASACVGKVVELLRIGQIGNRTAEASTVCVVNIHDFTNGCRFGRIGYTLQSEHHRIRGVDLKIGNKPGQRSVNADAVTVNGKDLVVLKNLLLLAVGAKSFLPAVKHGGLVDHKLGASDNLLALGTGGVGNPVGQQREVGHMLIAVEAANEILNGIIGATFFDRKGNFAIAQHADDLLIANGSIADTRKLYKMGPFYAKRAYIRRRIGSVCYRGAVFIRKRVLHVVSAGGVGATSVHVEGGQLAADAFRQFKNYLGRLGRLVYAEDQCFFICPSPSHSIS